MKCPGCGFISFDDLASCRKCGTDLGTLSDAPLQKNRYEKQQEALQTQGRPQALRPPGVQKTLTAIMNDLDELDAMSKDLSAGAPGAAPHQLSMAGADPPELLTAGFMIRLIAFMIDAFILSAIHLMLFFCLYAADGTFSGSALTPRAFLQLVYGPFVCITVLIEGFYFIYFHAASGQTVGKWACGIQVVSKAGGLLGPVQASMRFIGYFISWLPLYAGFLWIALDDSNQGWHDKLAGSYVIQKKLPHG